ncbi:MAG: DEAD/DEAH box helicase [Alphaproteobacteria bacterium]|nr:DEAD/DEAH box helicase [Alphaproteobacteria bacterium]
MAFLKAPASIARALAARDYSTATPVQAAVLEADAARDLLVSAQTGSGKTIAFGLAMAETLLEGADTLGRAAAPLALVIAPTRELALQVQRELNWLYQYAGARVVSCVGGMDPGAERRQLAGGAHIVVGTPGRLRDHLERRALDVTGLKVAVLDEADEMLDMGFHEDLQFILEATPADRRTLLFSATLPKDILSLAQQYQRDALRIATRGEAGGHADIEYRAVRIAPGSAERAVINLLRFIDPPSALVFCSTRQAVRHLEAMLLERGFAAVSLSGELSQNERNHALQALRDGRARVCVATDVAARGIDLPSLSLVIHADLPNDAQVLQHRSGRTGRAGRKGVSILLVPPSRRRRAEEMLGRARAQFTWSNPPSPEEIRKLDTEQLMTNPILTEPARDEDNATADALLAAHDPRTLAAAFVRLYRAGLPAPEEISVPPERSHEGKPARDGRKPRKDRNEREPRKMQAPGHDGPRKPRATRDDFAGGPWFLITVGRERNADPKWLLPEICRQGGVTKADIGAIRVHDAETRFQVSPQVAENFAAEVSARQKGGVRIFPAPGNNGEPSPPKPAAAQAGADHAPRQTSEKPRAEKSHAGNPHGGKPYDGKPRDGKPKSGKPFKGKKPFAGKPKPGSGYLKKPKHGKKSGKPQSG